MQLGRTVGQGERGAGDETPRQVPARQPHHGTYIYLQSCILSTALVGRQEGHPACDNIASAMLSFGGLLGIGLSYIDLKLIRNRKSSPLVLENSIQSLI